MKGLLNAASSNAASQVYPIDISRIDHIVKGQVTKRFVLAQSFDSSDNGLELAGGVETAEELSLSIFYRECRKDRQVAKEANNILDKHRLLETLDLIVPSSQQFKDLVSALQDLLTIYKKMKARTDQSSQLLEYLWIDMGKNLKETLSHAEWLDICDRLYVPLKKSLLTSLFKEVGRQLPSKSFFGGGLPLWAAAQLLDDTRFQYLDGSTSKESTQDPLSRLWHELWSTDPVPALKSGQLADPKKRPSPSELAQTISSVAFLSFLRTKQREFKLSIEDVVDRICALNGKIEKEPRLSKTRFFQYLLGDGNDALSPSRGKLGSDDMTHPLSHYWISSSHDTYLSHWNQTTVHDEYMYMSALHRGVRCLELDVWDHQDEPVICHEDPKQDNAHFLSVKRVFKIVQQFLLANPKCYPVILNIENHCDFKNQQRLASYLFKILGKSGLIVVPDDAASIDEADLLPSPQVMRGKVLVMGKRPRVVEEGAKVINDDYDDENDEYVADDLPMVLSRDEDEANLDKGIVTGFDSAGPIRADQDQEGDTIQHSAGELLFMAKEDLENAKIEAAKAEMKAHNLDEEADKAEKHADKLIDAAGLSKTTIMELAGNVRGDAIDTGDQTLEACRAQGEGVEVQEFFGDSVYAARATFTEAENQAIDAAQDATEVLQKLNEASVKLREAEAKLEASYAVERNQVAEYQQKAAEARAKREDADFAKNRLEKLQHLLAECEETANSAGNVVTTAMTESKISEKRAAETEARAARAASKAKEDRRLADEETKKEESLEREASIVHEELTAATDLVSSARKTVNETAQMTARANEQLKLIEMSTQYQRELKEHVSGLAEEKKDNGSSGKVLLKHAAKTEERRLLEIKMRKANSQLSDLEKKHRILKSKFERTAHLWKTQSDAASKLRKQADKSASIAEELAEHAEEEREAANLRHTAREKATSNVTEKDAYRQSLQAQVEEAERTAIKLEKVALEAKESAGSLAPAKEDLPDHAKNVRLVERRKTQRDQYLAEYKRKKDRKERTEARAEEAKRVFETSENVFSQAMRNAAQDQRDVHYQKSIDRTALVGFNRARLLRKQAEHALEDARFAQSNVTDHQIIVKRATEYKEKMERITAIPTSLAKMTFLHTTKHRHWDKSLSLPNTHVHSFSSAVLQEMKELNPQNPNRLREFSMEHICRAFPSSKDFKNGAKINSDPLVQWALGCQLVALNYGTFDEHILKADGRFRRNGSCGYVLKPEHLTEEDPLRERQEMWNIDIIAGSCLPSPESMKTKAVNPFVRIVVYSGDLEDKKVEHRTKVVLKNGVNPIWDETAVVKFSCKSPSLSLCVFTVWHKGEHGEEFIAGSSMPLSCMREGYRSIALFDAHHTRCGQYAYSSLLVSLTKSRK